MVSSSDLHDEKFSLDPFTPWAELRRTKPVFFDTVDNVWLISRHSDVISVFTDSKRFSNRLYRKTLGAVFGPTLLQLDGKPHIDHRKIIAPVFAHTRLDRYRSLLESTIDSVLDELDPSGFDLVQEVTNVLPGKIIIRMMGLPPEDDMKFQEWYESMMLGLWNNPALREKGHRAHRALHTHIDPIIEQRKIKPSDDILTRLIQANVTDLPSFISLLLTAGGDTTDKAIGNLWLNLLENPDQMSAVTNDSSLIDRAFDETMRHSPSLVYQGREALEDIEWHGVLIPQQAEVRLALGSANRDENVFASPNKFNIFREDLHCGLEHRSASYEDGAGHLGFGAGPHFCLGYALARL